MLESISAFLASAPSEETIIALSSIFGGMAFVIAIILISKRASLKAVREREETKREIAAYVAEGSITPEEGARLIDSGESPRV